MDRVMREPQDLEDLVEQLSGLFLTIHNDRPICRHGLDPEIVPGPVDLGRR